jgi:hypothetical protein
MPSGPGERAGPWRLPKVKSYRNVSKTPYHNFFARTHMAGRLAGAGHRWSHSVRIALWPALPATRPVTLMWQAWVPPRAPI